MKQIAVDVYIRVEDIETDFGDTIVMKSGVIIYVEDRVGDVGVMS